MKEKKYEEVGVNYRFFLGWRHASLAGIFLILYGIISITIDVYAKSPWLACFIPALCSPIGILFWVIDLRTSQLYYDAIIAGKKLEGFEGGIYSEISKTAKPPEECFKNLSHSLAINIIFWGTSALLFVFTLVIVFFATIKTFLP